MILKHYDGSQSDHRWRIFEEHFVDRNREFNLFGLLIRPPDDNREFSGLLVPPVIIHDHQWTNCEKNRADELETRPTRNTFFSFRPIFSTRILRPATSLPLFRAFFVRKAYGSMLEIGFQTRKHFWIKYYMFVGRGKRGKIRTIGKML